MSKQTQKACDYNTPSFRLPESSRIGAAALWPYNGRPAYKMIAMEFQENHYLKQTITAFDGDFVELDGERRPLPLVVGERVFRQPERDVAELTVASFQAALDAGAEVVLVGSGAKQQFLHPKIGAALAAQGVGLECMTTPAACRTLMLLQSEGRKVWAWLW